MQSGLLLSTENSYPEVTFKTIPPDRSHAGFAKMTHSKYLRVIKERGHDLARMRESWQEKVGTLWGCSHHFLVEFALRLTNPN